MTYNQWIGEMLQIEDTVREADKNVRAHEQAGLRARWESGRRLLAVRQHYGGRLPHKMLKQFTVALSVHASELTARMKFAEKFGTEDKLTNVISEFRTWFALKQKALTDTPREKTSKGKRSILRRAFALLEEFEPSAFDEDDIFTLDAIAWAVRRYQENITTLKRRRVVALVSVVSEADSMSACAM